MKRWTLFIFLAAILLLSSCESNVGAIGGTDGPTKIIISDEGTSSTPTQSEEEIEVKNPVVTIEMENGGIIKVELYPEKAENTVNNFIALINDGFYDGLIFHRVIPGFMIQGGDPTGTGMGGPGYAIAGEFSDNGYDNDLKHTRGVISMARSRAYDSAGSQFFIMVEEAPHLDGQYAAFGKVIEGMDVVDAIVSVPRNMNDKPNEDQTIKTVTIDTFDIEYPDPVTFDHNA